jgi:DNA polymerase I-like protein with 3'-5' exonuclease and polymerase domains
MSEPDPAAEALRVHLGVRTLGALASDLIAAGVGVLDTIHDADGRARLLVVRAPGRAAHVVDAATVGDLGQLRAALGSTPLAAYDATLADAIGLEPHALFDGQLVTQILFAGQIPDQPTLQIACERLNLRGPGEVAVSRFPKAEEVRRAAEHASTVQTVLAALRSAIRMDKLEHVVELDLQARTVLAGMTAVGIGVDREGWRQLVKAKSTREITLRKKLQADLGIQEPHDSEHILTCLRQRGLGLNSAETDELFEHVDVPGIRTLIDWRRTQAFVADAGKNVLAALERSNDGRVHARWNVLGTATGRITSSDPNLLGIPRAARNHFVPAPGYAFVHADIAAAQLRIAAEFTKDQALINAFVAGIDPHTATAQLFTEGGTRIDRQRAKPINFGAIFMITPSGLVKHARAEFGVDFSLNDAEQYLRIYRETYTEIARWQAETSANHEFITRSIGGRVRRYSPSENSVRSRLASPIQGTEADAIKGTLIALARELPTFDARLVLTGYDSVLVECKEMYAKAVAKLTELRLREGLERYLRRVPVVVEVDVRRSWGGS